MSEDEDARPEHGANGPIDDDEDDVEREDVDVAPDLDESGDYDEKVPDAEDDVGG